MKTTLGKIYDAGACKSGWRALVRYLGSTFPMHAEIPLREILKSNGLADALWCLKTVEGAKDTARMFFALTLQKAAQTSGLKQYESAVLDFTEKFVRTVHTTPTWINSSLWGSTEDFLYIQLTDRNEDAEVARTILGRALSLFAPSVMQLGRAALELSFFASRDKDPRATQYILWMEKEFLRILDCSDQGINPYPKDPHEKATKNPGPQYQDIEL